MLARFTSRHNTNIQCFTRQNTKTYQAIATAIYYECVSTVSSCSDQNTSTPKPKTQRRPTLSDRQDASCRLRTVHGEFITVLATMNTSSHDVEEGSQDTPLPDPTRIVRSRAVQCIACQPVSTSTVPQKPES
jgi:hypothetical protein